MTTTSLDPIAVDQQHVLQVYRRAPVVFVSGRGCALFSREGDRYLDLISGIGVAALGHGHPALARAIADQAATLIHTSNLFHHPLQAELAQRLSDLSGLPRAFFCNSGAEAVEACLKFARRYWRGVGGSERTQFVALQHSFHGRTMGALSVTWDEHYRTPFAPLVSGVTFVPADDARAVAAAITRDTAAVVVEPIQGEGGVRPLPTCHRKCDCGGVPQHRDAPHRRRNPVRSRTYRASVPLGHAWSAAGPDGTRQGAGRRRADRCGADVGKGRRERAARGSRQHIRRQPAGVPRGDCLRRRVGERRSHAERRPGGCASRGGFARDRHSTAGREGRSRCRPDVGNRIGSSGRSRRSGGARAQAARQPDVRHGDSSAAAVRHHRTGNRRGAAAPGSGD